MCVRVWRSRKGHLQFFMKEYEKALETYENGLKHDPENEELKDGMGRCIEAIRKVRLTSCPSSHPFYSHSSYCPYCADRDLHCIIRHISVLFRLESRSASFIHKVDHSVIHNGLNHISGDAS
jgi:hypothetical protein